MTYVPQFCFQKLLDKYQEGCLQKIRPQNIDIWPNDGHFMTMSNSWAVMTKVLKSGAFLQILSPFFACVLIIIISPYHIYITPLENGPLYFLEGGNICGSHKSRQAVGERIGLTIITIIIVYFHISQEEVIDRNPSGQ